MIKEKILVTGLAGTGKSTVCKELTKLGYEAYGIEEIKGLFNIYHKGTRDIFYEYNNLNPDHIKNAEWLFDSEKLKKLIDFQKTGIAFYCGTASNMDDLMSFFDKTIVLQVSPKTLNERLKNREGTDDIGNNQEGRDIVLGWKDWWEGEMKKKGAIFVDADGTPKEIVEKILTIPNLG